MATNRVDRILEILDNSHEVITFEGGENGYGSQVGRDKCWRCVKHVPDPASHNGLCEGCRAFLLGDTDEDPTHPIPTPRADSVRRSSSPELIAAMLQSPLENIYTELFTDEIQAAPETHASGWAAAPEAFGYPAQDWGTVVHSSVPIFVGLYDGQTEVTGPDYPRQECRLSISQGVARSMEPIVFPVMPNDCYITRAVLFTEDGTPVWESYIGTERLRCLAGDAITLDLALSFEYGSSFTVEAMWHNYALHTQSHWWSVLNLLENEPVRSFWAGGRRCVGGPLDGQEMAEQPDGSTVVVVPQYVGGAYQADITRCEALPVENHRYYRYIAPGVFACWVHESLSAVDAVSRIVVMSVESRRRGVDNR